MLFQTCWTCSSLIKTSYDAWQVLRHNAEINCAAIRSTTTSLINITAIAKLIHKAMPSNANTTMFNNNNNDNNNHICIALKKHEATEVLVTSLFNVKMATNFLRYNSPFKLVKLKPFFWQNRLPFCENRFFTGYRIA